MKTLAWTAGLLSAVLFFTVEIACGASADGVGTPLDLQGLIDREIQAGHRRIVVTPGRYRVVPQRQQHLALVGASDVEIVADGVEMICTETTRALTVSHCKNVTIRGLTIDYDPLPFTQGRITRLSPDKTVHEIELFAGYPSAEAVRNFKYEIFRPDTRTLRCEDRYCKSVDVVDSRHLRVTIPGGKAKNSEQVGDLIVIGAEHAPHGNAGHAIVCDNDVNVRLENITLFASNCFGFLEENCDGTTYYRCRIDRRPAESDLVRRADPRLRSLDADAFHSNRAIKGPAYIECAARFMGDDAINIHGTYHIVMAAQGRELRVLANGRLNVAPGEPLEVVAYDGRRLPDAKAVLVRPDGTIRDDERAWLLKQHMNENLKNARGTFIQAFTVTLDRDVDLARGAVVCSASRVGNGFTVRGCTFGFNRSRGILIKASRGEVVGNHMEGCRMSAILVAPEYWWMEAGSSSDLRIADNTITACLRTAISIEAAAGNGGIAPAGAHRNISITGNVVKDCPSPAIKVCSTVGLHVEKNTLEVNDAGKPVVEVNCEAGD